MNANPTNQKPTPNPRTSGSQTLDPPQTCTDTQGVPGRVEPSTDNGHCVPDTQSAPAVVGVSPSQPPTTTPTTPNTPPSDGWLELRIWAEMFEDAQKTRIANTNRAERGGCDPAIYEAHLNALKIAEHQCGLAMRRTLRRVAPPQVMTWQKTSNGIGEHLLARLLGHLGHPRHATPHHWHNGPPPEGHECETTCGSGRHLVSDPPFERTVGQLWQYCGNGAPARRSKGMTAEALAAQGNPTLKMVTHLLAEACMKTMTSPYRLDYEKARLEYEERTHTTECVRCGPSGKPAQIGTPWSKGHQHAAALRKTGKEILRDLWKVSAC